MSAADPTAADVRRAVREHNAIARQYAALDVWSVPADAGVSYVTRAIPRARLENFLAGLDFRGRPVDVPLASFWRELIGALNAGAARMHAYLPEARAIAAAAEAEAAHRARGVDLSEGIPRRLDRDALVWMYHGTSTAVLSTILDEGLRARPPRRVERLMGAQSAPGVYLTAWPGAGVGLDYAQRAATWLGGKPVWLEILIPWGALSPDTDDEHLASGRWQFVTDHVPPGWILRADLGRGWEHVL